MPADVETIDLRLHEFVRLHHVDLMRLIQYQINRFRDEIEEKRLLEQLVQYSFSKEQVRRLKKGNVDAHLCLFVDRKNPLID